MKLREGSLTALPGSCSSAGPVAAHLRCSVICSSESANNEQKANISSEAQINNVTACSGAEGSVQNSATFRTLLLKSSKKVVFLSEISSK